jgi:hypothetical protein
LGSQSSRPGEEGRGQPRVAADVWGIDAIYVPVIEYDGTLAYAAPRGRETRDIEPSSKDLTVLSESVRMNSEVEVVMLQP